MGKSREGIPEFMTSVTVCLRRNFNLKRLPAEWLCYRLARAILVMHYEGYAPIIVAGRLFTLWESLQLNDEFQSLFVALVTDERPMEDNKCLPMIEASPGISHVPDGTKGK